jgi:hypothetical protein
MAPPLPRWFRGLQIMIPSLSGLAAARVIDRADPEHLAKGIGLAVALTLILLGIAYGVARLQVRGRGRSDET